MDILDLFGYLFLSLNLDCLLPDIYYADEKSPVVILLTSPSHRDITVQTQLSLYCLLNRVPSPGDRASAEHMMFKDFRSGRAVGELICILLMHHQRPFKLLIHKQSVDLPAEKGFVGKISAAHLIRLSVSPREAASRFLLRFFGIYSVTNRWRRLPVTFRFLFALSKWQDVKISDLYQVWRY